MPFAVIMVMPNLGTETGDIEILRADIRSALAGTSGIPLRLHRDWTPCAEATPGKSREQVWRT